MPWSTPRTWTTGELATAANMNTYVSDNLSYLYSIVPAMEFGVADILNNSNVETTFATTTIGAGSLGTTGALDGVTRVMVTQSSGGAINYTFRVKFGATTIFAPVLAINSNAGLSVYAIHYRIANMESASAQRCHMWFTFYNYASASQTTQNAATGTYHMYNTCAENTAGALAFAFTGQMASATATGYIYHLGTELIGPLT